MAQDSKMMMAVSSHDPSHDQISPILKYELIKIDGDFIEVMEGESFQN